MAYHVGILALMVLPSLIATTDTSRLHLEEGYTVETVFDGNKEGMHPYSILPLSEEIVVLDSFNSSLFRISLPVSQTGSKIEVLAGGVVGFVDGVLTDAEFNHPKNIAADAKGNIYVADRLNFAIRKISKSGVTTIAGGMSHKAGNEDGPSQNATFSNDYDLTFVPSRCALLVSDRGTRMIRQINLPSGDCVQYSSLGIYWVPVVASLICFILGLVTMFFLQPYIVAHESAGFQMCRKTWKCLLTSVGKQMLTSCFAMQSAIAKTWPCQILTNFVKSSMTVVSLMFNVFFGGKQNLQPEPRRIIDPLEFLLDADIAHDKFPDGTKLFGGPMDDLINLDPFTESDIFGNFDPSGEKMAMPDVILDSTKPSSVPGEIEEFMQANVIAFTSEFSFSDTSKCLNELKSKHELRSGKRQLKTE